MNEGELKTMLVLLESKGFLAVSNDVLRRRKKLRNKYYITGKVNGINYVISCPPITSVWVTLIRVDGEDFGRWYYSDGSLLCIPTVTAKKRN